MYCYIFYLLEHRATHEYKNPQNKVFIARNSVDLQHGCAHDSSKDVHESCNKPSGVDGSEQTMMSSRGTHHLTALDERTVQQTMSMEMTCYSTGSNPCSTNGDVVDVIHNDHEPAAASEECKLGEHATLEEDSCCDSTQSTLKSTTHFVEDTMCTSTTGRSMQGQTLHSDNTTLRDDTTSTSGEVDSDGASSDEVLRTAHTCIEDFPTSGTGPILCLSPLPLPHLEACDEEWPTQHHRPLIQKVDIPISSQNIEPNEKNSTRNSSEDCLPKTSDSQRHSTTQHTVSPPENMPSRVCNTRIAPRKRINTCMPSLTSGSLEYNSCTPGTVNDSLHSDSSNSVSSTPQATLSLTGSARTNGITTFHCDNTLSTHSTTGKSNRCMCSWPGNVPASTSSTEIVNFRSSTPLFGCGIGELVNWNCSPISKASETLESKITQPNNILTSLLPTPRFPMLEASMPKTTQPVQKRRITLCNLSKKTSTPVSVILQNRRKAKTGFCGDGKRKPRRKNKHPLVYDPYSFLCNDDESVEGLERLKLAASLASIHDYTHAQGIPEESLSTTVVASKPPTCILITLAEPQQMFTHGVLKGIQTGAKRGCRRELNFGANVDLDILCEI